MALTFQQQLRRWWQWALLAITGGGAIVAFRLAYTFWETAGEEESGAIWYVAGAIVIAGGLYLLWQAWLCVRRLRAPP
ncbi:MAG: hypothetical protein AAGG65_07860 [Pseudomonadota bacterium]